MLRSIAAAALILSASSAFAADKTYQVTGPVKEVTDTTITVQKGKENWVIARDSSTKSEATPKVGDKVTVEYKMTATSITVKGGSEKAAEKAEKSEKGATETTTTTKTTKTTKTEGGSTGK